MISQAAEYSAPPEGSGLCDHLCCPALYSQENYVTATGVSGKQAVDKTACLIIVKDVSSHVR